MSTFRSRNQSTADVPADRDAIWQILTDPDRLAALTPLVASIDADGDAWCWKLGGISALGVTVAPAFTERMTFTDRERIEFRHDPPAGSDQKSGAEGVYTLADAPGGGTRLSVDITITAEVPLPKVAKRAVEKVMAT